MRRECRSYAHGQVLVIWNDEQDKECPLCKTKRELSDVKCRTYMAFKLEGLVLNVAEAAREWLWARKLVRETGKDEGTIAQADTRLKEAAEALDKDLMGRRLAEAVANGGS
jgi:hypothetical protein